MSEYECWISDFPSRCGNLIELFKAEALKNDREVTLLLAVASACIAIPYDHMHEPVKNAAPHPSGNRNANDNRKNNFDDLLQKEVGNLSFWPSKQATGFLFGKIDAPEGMPEDWPELKNCCHMESTEKFDTLIKHIRNSLAHGNIYTRGKSITEIILLSRKSFTSTEFSLLSITPAQLQNVVFFWIEQLQQLNISLDVAAERLAE